MYCLWIGARKIYNLKQLKRHFDFDVVEMYLLGGGLSRWLRQCNEAETADAVDKIDLSEDISKQLSEVFSVKLPKGRSNTPVNAPESSRSQAENNSSLPFAADKFGSFDLKSSFSAPSEIGSFNAEWGSFGSKLGSFGGQIGSFASASFNLNFYIGSFETSSFNLSGAGSFGSGAIYGSFVSNSFRFYEYEYEYNTSFSLGSFSAGSFTLEASAPSSFDTGSFGINSIDRSAPCSGSEYVPCPAPASAQLSAEEKIKLNISYCPLNRFGYGLHLI
ncbi:MAG: hypothetical protein NC394_03715 [Bacteroides sp.]|nr:hypothetical protein [Bacteroides sp.]